MKRKGKLTSYLRLAFLLACGGCTLEAHEANSAADLHMPEPQVQPVSVDTVGVKTQILQHEILATGKVYAPQEWKLSFESGGRLAESRLQVGSRIRKGQVLARLDTTSLALAYEQALNRLAQARIERLDQSVQHDFNFQEGDTLPPHIQQMVDIESGYRQALTELKRLRYQLTQSQLRAPFSGVIADMKVKPYQQLAPGEELATLINLRQAYLEVGVLEQELPALSVGQQAQVRLAANPQQVHQAHIKAINPQVNEHGLIALHLEIRSPKGHIYPGMQAEVSLQVPAPQAQLTIPYAAVLKRAGRDMVFCYEKGLAKWKYVSLGARNTDWVAVRSGIEPTDFVIVSQHVGLAHDAEVQLSSEHP